MTSRALDTACQAALGVLLVAAVGVSLPTLVQIPLAGDVPRLVVVYAACAVAVAALHAIARVRRRRRLGPDARRLWLPVVLVMALAVWPLLYFPPVASVVFLALIAVVHLAPRQHSDEACWAAIGVATGLGLLAAVSAPGLVPALSLPAVLVPATVAAVLCRARATERRVAASGRIATAGADDVPRLGRRVTSAAGVGVLLLVGTLVWLPAAQTVPEPLRDMAADDRRRELDREERERREDAADRAGGSDELGPGLSWSSELALFGRIPMPPYEVLMRVVPERDGVALGHQGTLYLRGVALSRFTERGARMRGRSAPTRLRDADDGSEDGWVVLDDAVAPDATLELLVEHYPAQLDEHDWSLLFAPLGVRAVELPEVRWAADRFLALPRAPDDWFGYRLSVRDPSRPRPGILTARAGHPDSRFVSLPPDSRDLDRIVAVARGLTEDRRTDLRRVQAVVDFFRTRFEYELTGSEFGGVSAMREFLDRRTGYCTYFASTSALMLRSQGIPARVASGFMVRDWHEDGYYLAGPEDMHAWLEVHFEGLGWVAFEPTPPDARARVVEANPFEEPGVAAWAGDLARRVSDWQRGAGRDTTLRDVVATFEDAPRRLGTSLRRHPVVTGLLLLGLTAVAVLLLRRRRGGGSGDRPPPTTGRRRAERLSDVLDRRLAEVGHPRPASRPVRLHVRRLALAGVSWAPAAEALVDDLYAARYSGAELDAAAEASLRSRIESVVQPASGEGSTPRAGRAKVRG